MITINLFSIDVQVYSLRTFVQLSSFPQRVNIATCVGKLSSGGGLGGARSVQSRHDFELHLTFLHSLESV